MLLISIVGELYHPLAGARLHLQHSVCAIFLPLKIPPKRARHLKISVLFIAIYRAQSLTFEDLGYQLPENPAMIPSGPS